MAEQLIVLVKRFGEAEARVGDHVVHANAAQVFQAACKIGHHVGHHVVVVSQLLHCRRCAAHVHHDVRHAQLGHRGPHRLVEVAASDVVHYVGTQLLHGSLGNACAEGVDRYIYLARNTAHRSQCHA